MHENKKLPPLNVEMKLFCIEVVVAEDQSEGNKKPLFISIVASVMSY